MEKTVLERIKQNLEHYQVIFRLLNYSFSFKDNHFLIESASHDYIEITESNDTLNAYEYSKIIRINNETITLLFLRDGTFSLCIDGRQERVCIVVSDDLLMWRVSCNGRENEWLCKERVLLSTPQQFDIKESSLCHHQTQAIHSMGVRYVDPHLPNNCLKEYSQVFNNFLTTKGKIYGTVKIKEIGGNFYLGVSHYRDSYPLMNEPDIFIDVSQVPNYNFALVNTPQAQEIVGSAMSSLDRRIPNLRSTLAQYQCLCPKIDGKLFDPVTDDFIQEEIQKYTTITLGDIPVIPVLSKSICKISD